MTTIEDGNHKEMAAITYGTTDRQEAESSKIKPEKDKTFICEVVVMVLVIALSWMLLLLPIIFYHLPDEVYAEKVSILGAWVFTLMEKRSILY